MLVAVFFGFDFGGLVVVTLGGFLMTFAALWVWLLVVLFVGFLVGCHF